MLLRKTFLIGALVLLPVSYAPLLAGGVGKPAEAGVSNKDGELQATKIWVFDYKTRFGKKHMKKQNTSCMLIHAHLATP